MNNEWSQKWEESNWSSFIYSKRWSKNLSDLRKFCLFKNAFLIFIYFFNFLSVNLRVISMRRKFDELKYALLYFVMTEHFSALIGWYYLHCGKVNKRLNKARNSISASYSLVKTSKGQEINNGRLSFWRLHPFLWKLNDANSTVIELPFRAMSYLWILGLVQKYSFRAKDKTKEFFWPFRPCSYELPTPLFTINSDNVLGK